MHLVIKIIILSLFFNIGSLLAQNNDLFKQEIKPKLKRGMSNAKVIVWTDKKTYKIGEKIKIVVEWNKGDFIDEDNFKEETNLNLISTALNQSYIAGEKLCNKVYVFTANKTGKIKLPRFKIEYDFIIYESSKLKFRVRKK